MASISKATIDNAMITTASISQAYVDNASISTATISQATIYNASISEASISNATITGMATINVAKISTASISNVTVTGAATINMATISTASIGSATVANTLTVGGLLTANGGIVTNGATVAVGTGKVTAGSVTIDGTTNRISGLSPGINPTDAVNMAQFTTAVDGINFRLDDLEHKNRIADQGVAMGFAMNAAPLNLSNGESGVSAGLGTYQGQWAGAVKLQVVTDSGFGLGANVGFSADAVGGGVGASIKF